MSSEDQRPEAGHVLSAEAVRERFDWARKRGHSRYLWPDVPQSEWRRGLELLAGVVSTTLASPPGAPAALRSRPECGPDAIGVAAFTSGLGPLVGLWIEQGRVASEDPVRSLLLEHLTQGRRRAERVRNLLQDVAERFARAGVPMTLLKGAFTAPRYFPEPGVRPAQDVDVVVPAGSFALAEDALRAGGYRLRGTLPGPVRSDWSPPGEVDLPRSLTMTHAENPLRVDLHRSYRRKLFGVRVIDLTPAEDDLTEIPDLAGAVNAVDGPLLALTTATHASEDLEGMQLVRLVELHLIARGSPGTPVFGPEALERATALGALRFAYPALALAERLLPGTVDAHYLAAARREAPARMRRIVDTLTPASAQRIGHHSLAERFMAVRGPVEAVRRLAHMLVPTSTGPSPRRLAEMYRERWYRLRRRTLRLRERGDAATRS